MRVDIPDFSLLIEPTPMGAVLKGRVVIFHFPTHTILELVPGGYPLLESISPRYEWKRINQYGEVDKLAFIVHRYVTDDLTEVFEQARAWYQHLLDWWDATDDTSAHPPFEWEKKPDDLPN